MTIEPKETEEASTGRLNVKTIRSFSGQTAPFDTLIDSSRNGPADAPPPPPPPPPPQAQSAAARRGRTRGPGRKRIRGESIAWFPSGRCRGRQNPGGSARDGVSAVSIADQPPCRNGPSEREGARGRFRAFPHACRSRASAPRGEDGEASPRSGIPRRSRRPPARRRCSRSPPSRGSREP